jgi:hypothetical protein
VLVPEAEVEFLDECLWSAIGKLAYIESLVVLVEEHG